MVARQGDGRRGVCDSIVEAVRNRLCAKRGRNVSHAMPAPAPVDISLSLLACPSQSLLLCVHMDQCTPRLRSLTVSSPLSLHMQIALFTWQLSRVHIIITFVMFDKHLCTSLTLMNPTLEQLCLALYPSPLCLALFSTIDLRCDTHLAQWP